MAMRIFEDLVVSAPQVRHTRRAALMPVSVAMHACALAIVLVAPAMRPSELPPPAMPVLRIPVAPRTAPPSTLPEPAHTATVRVRRGPTIPTQAAEPRATTAAIVPVPTEELPLGPPTDAP